MKINIENYFSKIKKELLLHQSVHIIDPTKPGRENISPEKESLQAAYLNLKKDQTFRAHKHIYHNREMPMAQESWIVISGSIEVTYYDINDEILSTTILKQGECTITYRGGHNYKSLEENSNVYELKTGPYLGQVYDKVFI